MVFICCLSFGQAECLTSIFLEKPDLDYTVLYFWIKNQPEFGFDLTIKYYEFGYSVG